MWKLKLYLNCHFVFHNISFLYSFFDINVLAIKSASCERLWFLPLERYYFQLEILIWKIWICQISCVKFAPLHAFHLIVGKGHGVYTTLICPKFYETVRLAPPPRTVANLTRNRKKKIKLFYSNINGYIL